jgi:hypothetical protein
MSSETTWEMGTQALAKADEQIANLQRDLDAAQARVGELERIANNALDEADTLSAEASALRGVVERLREALELVAFKGREESAEWLARHGVTLDPGDGGMDRMQKVACTALAAATQEPAPDAREAVIQALREARYWMAPVEGIPDGDAFAHACAKVDAVLEAAAAAPSDEHVPFCQTCSDNGYLKCVCQPAPPSDARGGAVTAGIKYVEVVIGALGGNDARCACGHLRSWHLDVVCSVVECRCDGFTEPTAATGDAS